MLPAASGGMTVTRKRISISFLVAFLVVLLVVAWSHALVRSESDVVKDEIRNHVLTSYVHGAFNEQNTEAMREGFHPVFKIHGVSDGALSAYPIKDWIAAIEERKAKPDYERENWTHRFPIIDVTGDAAIVKVELFHDSEHVYTDYWSLLKFEDGWKITDKVYHRHPES